MFWHVGDQVKLCVMLFAEMYIRLRCFDLRTLWYSYQSNRLINRLIVIRLKNRQNLKFGRRHSQRSLPNKEHNGVAQEARKLQYL